MFELKKLWYHQEVLLESFPMNGHVSRFRQLKNFWAISVSRPSVLEELTPEKTSLC
jgi:hypothetical protein